MKIREFIVVEGKDDTVAVRRATRADTIETNGSALSRQALDMIRHAQETRGVIVLTDPDYPGQRIRALIEEAVPGVRHAFLPKREAIAKNGAGLGVEHASDEAIRAALAHVSTVRASGGDSGAAPVPLDVLLELRLTGHPSAKERRSALGERLHIGSPNGKQLQKRLAQFGISEERLRIEAARLDEGELQ